MQRLNRGMMGRYEIDERFPARVNAVQFGLDETLLGVVDSLIDRAGAGVGIAALRLGTSDGRDPAQLLTEQDGMFTLFTRGYLGEQAVNREEVVQSILRAGDESDIDALAVDPALALAILGESDLRKALAPFYASEAAPAGPAGSSSQLKREDQQGEMRTEQN